MTKQRGRKATPDLIEARNYVLNNLFMAHLDDDKNLSNEVKERLLKAVKLGLGIKEEKVILKPDTFPYLESEIKENKEAYERIETVKRSSKNKTSLSSVEGDEYFNPEDCKEVEY